jgi:hypothetical protein
VPQPCRMIAWAAQSILISVTTPMIFPLDEKTRSQKHHANITLLTRVLETYDCIAYLDAQGGTEWEQDM